jgi:putative transposase
LITTGIDASIGSVGDAYDNALAESTIGLYKTELISPTRPLARP